MIALLKYWRLIGVGVLLAVLGIQTWRLSSEKAHSAALEASSALQVANYRAAYQQAVATAYADKIAKEKQYEAARQSSAAAYADLAGQYRAAVLQRAAAAHTGGDGKADLPGNAESAGFPAPSAEGSFLSITADDALICADNTAYAQAAFEWAKNLETTK